MNCSGPGQLCRAGLPDGAADVGAGAVVMISGAWGGQGSRTGPGTTFDSLCGTGILVPHVSRFLRAGTNDHGALRCGDSPLCSSSCFPKDIGIVDGHVYRSGLPYFSGRSISVCRAWAEGCSCSELPFTHLRETGVWNISACSPELALVHSRPFFYCLLTYTFFYCLLT